jgi:F0F1-type ATP synthase membrane subunit c/vacuolar-type H+-ATPase subunit K
MIIVGLAMMKNTISINIVSNNSVTAIPREPRLLLECLVYLICSPLCESFVHYKL